MGKFRRQDQQHAQQELWVPAAAVVTGPQDGFYAKLNAVLAKLRFTENIHRLCEPHYKGGAHHGGRPPIDPVVLFKMMIVGFLEGLGSDRGIAARCADSLTIRRFLGYSLTEQTPDHSSFTVFRQRLPQSVFDAAHLEILKGLKAHGLLKGRDLGIDSSIIEANASLRGLVRRNTEQSYRDYVRELAAKAGIDTNDAAAVARFDRQRTGRKTSNKDWHNPHDPDAKVGRTKAGACDMVYKPQHIVDLSSGAIIAAEVRPGDAGDTQELSGRIMDAVETVKDLYGDEHCAGASRVRSVTADKGYHAAGELAVIQHETGARTVIGDAQAARRRLENLEPEMRTAVQKASRAVRSQSGKDLLRQRGEKIERGFAHTLDSGGLRRTTLRGLPNINKRYLCGILAFNLCLIMRKLTGWGTPKQTAAAGAAERALLCRLWRALRAVWEHRWPATGKSHSLPPQYSLFLTEIATPPFFAGIRISPRFSTGS
jgi:transposase